MRSVSANFAWCDSFSKQPLKTVPFQIFPDDNDWKKARELADMHAFYYGREEGYRGPLLYQDKNYVHRPNDSWEYADWYHGSGLRYRPEAINCYLWNHNEWLRHKIITGIYIDDMWISTSTGWPNIGPAYLMEDGKVQPGFEFFDFREFLKRLRWIYHDNDMQPSIWVHQTQTPYAPHMSFVDFMLDGEDRFQNWASKADFMDCWPVDRMRYSSPAKLGIIQVWMNKIGNDKPKPKGMEHWFYRQLRSYYGALLLHDIDNCSFDINNLRKLRECLLSAGPEVSFRGYWEPEKALQFKEPGIYTSLFVTSGRTIAFIVNYTRETAVFEAQVNPAAFGIAGLKSDEIKFQDMDDYDPPPGENLLNIKIPEISDVSKTLESDDLKELQELLDDAVEDDRKNELRDQGVFIFGDHNFELKGDTLRLRIRAHDFRVIEVCRKKDTPR
ncbi:MAG: hypothetical protein HQL31_09695 [Planctomycetes bacterium]|nr:hypothetical protein [Planctomycetota bacterium]